jgi:hypothetical protein
VAAVRIALYDTTLGDGWQALVDSPEYVLLGERVGASR